MTGYKKGQWLKHIGEGDGNNFTKEKNYKISGIHRNGLIGIFDDAQSVRTLTVGEADQYFTPSPKTWQTLECGDVIIDKDGDKSKVIEVLENSFMRSNWDNYDSYGTWNTFKQAEEKGWKVEGREDICPTCKRAKE